MEKICCLAGGLCAKMLLVLMVLCQMSYKIVLRPSFWYHHSSVMVFSVQGRVKWTQYFVSSTNIADVSLFVYVVYSSAACPAGSARQLKSKWNDQIKKHWRKRRQNSASFHVSSFCKHGGIILMALPAQLCGTGRLFWMGSMSCDGRV